LLFQTTHKFSPSYRVQIPHTTRALYSTVILLTLSVILIIRRIKSLKTKKETLKVRIKNCVLFMY
jgi:phosphatidylserine synthase